jgi:hypothetical protein
MSIQLSDDDAIELADLLDWLTAFFATAQPHMADTFTAWACNPTAVAELAHDLQRWSHQLCTTVRT